MTVTLADLFGAQEPHLSNGPVGLQKMPGSTTICDQLVPSPYSTPSFLEKGKLALMGGQEYNSLGCPRLSEALCKAFLAVHQWLPEVELTPLQEILGSACERPDSPVEFISAPMMLKACKTDI